MIQFAPLADMGISFAALLGTLVLISVVRGRGAANELNKRFLFALWLVATMLASRILFWATSINFFDIITVIAAGTIPLAVLLLTEGLLRRHAPIALKLIAICGTIFFLISAFLPASLADSWLYWALFSYQLIMFFSAGWLVLNRDKEGLSSTENRMVERIALSLVLIIPAFATDFRSDFFPVPIRLGGLAILYLCWLSVGLGRTQLSHRDTVRSFLVITLSAIFAGVILGGAIGLGLADIVRASALCLSASILAAIYNDSVSLKAEDRRDTLMRHLVHGNASNIDLFLGGFQDHGLIDDALILDEGDLSDFDSIRLQKIFSERPVRRLEDLKGADMNDREREQLAWFFEKYESTHVLLASQEPIKLLALKMPTLSSTPGAELELEVFQKMASLISKQRAAT
ncbi:MAG: hypothetical protein AAF362_02345 [Pseudomonadota bacterium]